MRTTAQKRPSDEPSPSPKRARNDAAALEREASSPLPSPASVSLPPPRKPLPPHQTVLAPMVGGSELAFRLLARRHGAQLCYTPMILCDDFCKPGAGVALLERHPDDCPVVAHFAGNDADKLLEVAKRAEACSGVVAVDLNLGCPQRSAQSGHFGAFLCEPADRRLLLSIVSTLARSLTVPFFCKIRLLDELDDTLEFAQQLQVCASRRQSAPRIERPGQSSTTTPHLNPIPCSAPRARMLAALCSPSTADTAARRCDGATAPPTWTRLP